MIESEDTETPSARDTISSESTLPLSETNFTIEEKEPEKLGLFENNNTSTFADTGTFILLNEVSSDPSKFKLKHERVTFEEILFKTSFRTSKNHFLALA